MTYESFSQENQIDEGFSLMSKKDKAELEKVNKAWGELMTKLGIEGDLLEKFNKLNKQRAHKQKIINDSYDESSKWTTAIPDTRWCGLSNRLFRDTHYNR